MRKRKGIRILLLLFSFIIGGCLYSFIVFENGIFKDLDNKESQNLTSLKLSAELIELKWSFNTSSIIQSVATSTDGNYIVAGTGHITATND